MSDEKRLDQLIAELQAGGRSLEDVLVAHPDLADADRALLQTAARVRELRSLEPSSVYQASARQELKEFLDEHPRGLEQSGRGALLFPGLLRYAAAAASVLLTVLVTGTALAQTAGPGDFLYPWKTASEQAYRALHPDQTGADLQLARRRLKEILAADDPEDRRISLEGYRLALERLADGTSPGEQAAVRAALQRHRLRLDAADLEVPALNTALRDLSLPGEENGDDGLFPTLLPEDQETGAPKLEPTLDPLPVLPTPTLELNLDEPEGAESLPGA